MNRQAIQIKINALEKQLAELKEELNRPENKVFKPKPYDDYYTIQGIGTVLHTIWTNSEVDGGRDALSNCFETEEEAKFEVEKLKVIAELKKFAKEHNQPIDWDDINQDKCYIRYDWFNKMVYVYLDLYGLLRNTDIYFSSQELAKQAVLEIGEDRVKKYYLGVEE